MKPISDFPGAPLLREKLKERDEVSIEIIIGKLKSGEAQFPSSEFHTQEHSSLTKRRKVLRRQMQHSHHLLFAKELERLVRVHGFTSVSQLPSKKESSIA